LKRASDEYKGSLFEETSMNQWISGKVFTRHLFGKRKGAKGGVIQTKKIVFQGGNSIRENQLEEKKAEGKKKNVVEKEDANAKIVYEQGKERGGELGKKEDLRNKRQKNCRKVTWKD